MVIHSNPEFNILAFIQFLTIYVFKVLHGYEIQCPGTVHWNVRAKDFCIMELKYICLYDDVKANTTESCSGPLATIAKGYKWVIRGNPDRGECSLGTYQPYEHRNVKASACVYQKSLCSEEGQVVFDMGNTIDDQKCRCDYTRGYDFVGKPGNRCYCYPLTEDCSCFLRRCDITGVRLSQDYECIDNYVYNTTAVCPTIVTILDKGLQPEIIIKQKDIKLYTDSYNTLDVQRNLLKIILTILIVCTPLAVPPLVLVVIQIHKCIHRPVFEETLNDRDCIEGDKKVVFQCRVSRKNDEASWSTDSEIPLSDASITKQGYIHRVAIENVKRDHSGNYTVTVRGQSCTAILTVKVVDIFSSYLEPQTCFFGEDVKFECTLAVDESSSNWFKDKNDYESPSHWQTTSTSQKHVLVIKAVSFADEGQYNISVRNVISSALLVVRDELLIKTEDIHYLLSVYILSKFATPAVRDVFDEEFNPNTLRETFQKNIGTLSKLKRQKHINREEWKLLFDHHEGSPINSAQFDLRLMVILLRNITRFDIFNSLPEPTNTSKDADLSRIHYYRNLIAHNHGRMSNDDLVQSVKDLMEAAKRLRCTPMTSSSVGKQQQLWIDHFDSPDKLTQAVKAFLDRKPKDIPEIVRKISTEERDFLQIVFLLHRVACPAVRLKFNRIFCPLKLKQTLKDNIKDLTELKDQKRITPSQWDLLFPRNNKTSSKDFGLKLMLILISNFKKPVDVNEEEMQALKSLESYLYTVARSTSGQVSKDNFEDFCKDICSAIILIGGDSYEKRFTNICCSLHIDSKITKYIKTLCSE